MFGRFPVAVDIFPNPTASEAFFVENLSQTDLSLNIRMPDGRLVFAQKIGKDRTEIALPNLPVGTYFLFFENRDGQTVQIDKLVRI